MKDIDGGLEELFTELGNLEKVKLLNNFEKQKFDFSAESIVWEIDTEIDSDFKCIELQFHILFSKDFPLDFPKIYLSPSSFETIGYIPHIDTKKFICTFDTEIASTNPDEPFGVIKACLKRAKEIVSNGISGQNHNDYNEEFIAYWEGKYHKKDKYPERILSIIDKIENKENLKLICLKDKLNSYSYVLHDGNQSANRFKKFLKDNKLKFHERQLLYIKELKLNNKPPFDIKNKDVLKFFNDDETFESFVEYINKPSFIKLVLTSKDIKGQEFLFGWFHNDLNTHVKGFRRSPFKPFDALKGAKSNLNVQRITTNRFTENRIENRTSGGVNLEDKFSFVIAGIGSVGSNLFYYLNSLNFPEFKLIDSDILSLENIGRHFLGFNFIGNYKTKSLQDYAVQSNPIQSILTKEESIVNILKTNPKYINDSDYLFVAIGKLNIEKYIGKALDNGLLKIPTFFLWVEPYLCGGHCLYIDPKNSNYFDFFENDLFRYNVISNKEYINNNTKLSLKEAGCQTSYVPYSASSLVGFLSAVFPFVTSIINANDGISKSITWIGDTENIINLNIELSDMGKSHNNGEVIEKKI